MTVLNEIPLSPNTNALLVQFKLAVLALIFVYAFFKFTWSIRQFGFVSVLLGASVEYTKVKRRKNEIVLPATPQKCWISQDMNTIKGCVRITSVGLFVVVCIRQC